MKGFPPAASHLCAFILGTGLSLLAPHDETAPMPNSAKAIVPLPRNFKVQAGLQPGDEAALIRSAAGTTCRKSTTRWKILSNSTGVRLELDLVDLQAFLDALKTLRKKNEYSELVGGESSFQIPLCIKSPQIIYGKF